MINFDEPIARHFFAHNAAYLATEFHIDGIRFDFTRPIHIDDDGNITKRGSGGGWDFLREIRAKVKSVDRGIILIAEELPNDWYVTREEVAGVWRGDRHGPFDSQWSDPFHDRFEDVLKGAHLDNLKAVLTDYGDSWQDAVAYTESHDEVGNEDDRVAHIARDGRGWELSQVAAAGTLLARGIPMLFMGQESGEWAKFDINANDQRLPLDGYEAGVGRTKVRDWYARMIEIRKSDPTSFAWPDILITHIHDGNGVIAFTRDGGKYLVVLNFKGSGWDNYVVGVSGRYRELANTSWPQYNTRLVPQRSRADQPFEAGNGLSIPPYGAVVLRREG
jgi:1,4-alpha-glucan branching enzyme